MIHEPDCPLIPKLLGQPGRCDLASCGKPLPARRTRWCSNECAAVFHNEILRNHDWSTARAVALARDKYQCVKCGSRGLALPEMIAATWRCHEFPVAHASTSYARRQAIEDAVRAIRELDREEQLEVNHIAPLAGRMHGKKRVTHSMSGCWHHLENLETLCVPCHRVVTEQQRVERARSNYERQERVRAGRLGPTLEEIEQWVAEANVVVA